MKRLLLASAVEWVAAAGMLVGGNYLIAGESKNERFPRLAAGGSSGTLVLWDRDNSSGSTGCDLYGRYLDSSGELHGAAFTLLADAGQQMSQAGSRPLFVTNITHSA